MTSKYSLKIALISTRDSKWLAFGHHWSTTAVCCYTQRTDLSCFDFKLLEPFVCPLLTPIRCLKCRSLWLLCPLLTPDAHPQARASLWSSHHLSAPAQRPPSRLISGLLLRAGAHIEGCWLLHGNGRGAVISSFLWATGCFAWIQEFRTTSPQWEGWLEGSAEITSGDESE